MNAQLYLPAVTFTATYVTHLVKMFLWPFLLAKMLTRLQGLP